MIAAGIEKLDETQQLRKVDTPVLRIIVARVGRTGQAAGTGSKSIL